mmetsp:Transcript_37074/g.106776  ORF Transcript_37074/g.106776 Transcript_37074/m.106776 type:complete len:466 (-) Transcript_37074:42-1439(-)
MRLRQKRGRPRAKNAVPRAILPRIWCNHPLYWCSASNDNGIHVLGAEGHDPVPDLLDSTVAVRMEVDPGELLPDEPADLVSCHLLNELLRRDVTDILLHIPGAWHECASLRAERGNLVPSFLNGSVAIRAEVDLGELMRDELADLVSGSVLDQLRRRHLADIFHHSVGAGHRDTPLGAEGCDFVPDHLNGSVAIWVEVDVREGLLNELTNLASGHLLDKLLRCNVADVLLHLLRAGHKQTLGTEGGNLVPSHLNGSVAVGLEVDAGEILLDELADLVSGHFLDELLGHDVTDILLDISGTGHGQASLGAKGGNLVPHPFNGSVAIGVEMDLWEPLLNKLADLVRSHLLNKLLRRNITDVFLHVPRAGHGQVSLGAVPRNEVPSFFKECLAVRVKSGTRKCRIDEGTNLACGLILDHLLRGNFTHILLELFWARKRLAGLRQPCSTEAATEAHNDADRPHESAAGV